MSEELDALLKGVGPQHKFSKWINSMSDTLKENMYAGELIQKHMIPNYYVEKYGVNHLFRYGHPEGYRSCYWVVQGSTCILDLMSHDEYEKRFGYRST
jgi:hypothetical protein